MNDGFRPGWPSTSTTNENTEAVKKLVMENCRITIREVAKDVGISVGSCYAIFSEILGPKRVAAKFVPKLHIRSASRIGKNAGTSVLYLRRITLKGTT